MEAKNMGEGVFGNPANVSGKQDVTGSIMSNSPGSGEVTSFPGADPAGGLSMKESISGNLAELGMESSGAGQMPTQQPRDSAARGTRFG